MTSSNYSKLCASFAVLVAVEFVFIAPVVSQSVPPDYLPSLRSIGPAVMGGRIDDIAVVEDRPGTLFVGAASGGLWKTDNYGTTWTSLFDAQPNSSIADVALSASDSETVWVGTGEPNNRQSSSFGNGVYRSDDGGRHFTHMGLDETRHIGRVLIHPSDSLRVFVAAVGNLWAPSAERGVYRTLDGGLSWELVLFIDEDTGVIDMAMDPRNPNVLFAAAYQRRRVPWGFAGGGPGSGLYKSNDGGAHWRRLSTGLPEAPIGRIGIDIFRSDSRIVYASVEHRTEGGVYRSVDRGESWEKVNELNPRPMYYSKIRLDPNDENRVYLLSSAFYVSTDGGKTFVRNTKMTPTYDVGVHGDHHALWVDPSNSRHMILGGDGGLYLSWDRSDTWDKVNNIPLGQFYGVAVDHSTPYRIYAGAQDTHSWGGPSATRRQIGILNQDWFQTNFGDGMYQQADPSDPRIVYTESQGGNVIRLDAETGNRTSIKPYPRQGEDGYRFHWTSPLLISPRRPSRLYLGGNRLFISDDRGQGWRATADLSWNEDRDELPIMGSVPDETTLSKHDGVAAWGTITSIAESSVREGLLFVGTDDGRIHRSSDDGDSWQSLEGNISDFEMHRSKVSRIVASNHEPTRVYVSVDRHHLGDFRPHLLVSEDSGESWQELSATLPPDGWVNVMVEHPDNPSVLFVGTETGLFVSFDAGAHFSRMRNGFPTVPVDDLTIHPRDKDLVVGTHGRSIYILDDTMPLAEYQVSQQDPQLFSVRDSRIFLPWKDESYGGQRQFIGRNPPRGAVITYYLPEGMETTLRLVVRREDDSTVRVLSESVPQAAGFHRLVWDLREPAPVGVENGRGALVLPGRYRVDLEVEGETTSRAIEVVLDPVANVSLEDYSRRYQFQRELNAWRERVGEARSRADALGAELDRVSDRLAGEDGVDALIAHIERLATELESVQVLWERQGRGFANPSDYARAGRLFGELSGDEVRQGTLSAPTPVQLRRFDELRTRGESKLTGLERLVSVSIPELNEQLGRELSLQVKLP